MSIFRSFLDPFFLAPSPSFARKWGEPNGAFCCYQNDGGLWGRQNSDMTSVLSFCWFFCPLSVFSFYHVREGEGKADKMGGRRREGLKIGLMDARDRLPLMNRKQWLCLLGCQMSRRGFCVFEVMKHDGVWNGDDVGTMWWSEGCLSARCVECTFWQQRNTNVNYDTDSR